MEYDIQHMENRSCFSIEIDGQLAHLDYILHNDIINFTHTFVPPLLEGRGIGAALAKFALNYAEANHLKVIPTCSFIKVYIDRHPDFSQLLA